MCNRCGNTNPAGVLNCQVCGTPLATKFENEYNPRAAAQNQPPLPAWLESLRAGESSAASTNAPSVPGFSAADLLDEGTLPSWLRSGRGEAQNQSRTASTDAFSQGGAQSALRPSSQLGPNTGDEGLPSRNIAANSLVDPSSLPSWMQSNTPGKQEPQSNISAASLVQPDALPEWMRSLPTSQPSPASPTRPDMKGNTGPSQPAISQSFAAPVMPEVPAPLGKQQGFSAGELVDPSSLPSWMTQQGTPSSAAPSAPAHGLSAKDLVDPASLPSWMAAQGGQGQGTAPNAPAAGTNGQSGLLASSLLDSDALPPWLRQQGAPAQPAPAFNVSPSAPSAPPRPQTTGQNSWPAAPSHLQTQGPAGTVSASSFIDMNSLPGWMRSEGGSNQQAAGAGQGRPGYIPPRVENVRVPNRPRNELNATDNSEAAANVFASMLGVASPAPQYPGQAPSAPQGGQYGGGPQPPQNIPPSSAPANRDMGSGIYGQAPATPAAMPYAAPVPPPMYGAPNGYQSGIYQGSMPGNYAAGSPQGFSPYGNMSAGNSPQIPANYSGGVPGAGSFFPSTPGVAEEQKSAKPAKRSIFETLRNMFFR